MNIWILYYSSLFLHISILYNFIFLLLFSFFVQKILKNIYILIIIDEYTNEHNPSVYIFQRRGEQFTSYATITLLHHWWNYFVSILQKVRINLQ